MTLIKNFTDLRHMKKSTSSR